MAFSRWHGLAVLVTLWWGAFALAEEGAGRIEGVVTKDGEAVQAVLVLVNELKATDCAVAPLVALKASATVDMAGNGSQLICVSPGIYVNPGELQCKEYT